MEAMSLGDRIGIINQGRIVQIGTGDEIYYMPANEFVAQLMGDPEINLLACGLTRSEDGYALRWAEAEGAPIPLPRDEELYARFDKLPRGSLHLGLRPQNIHYRFAPSEGAVRGTVYSFETIGNKSVLIVEVGRAHLRMIAPNGLKVKLDQDVYVSFEIRRAMFFDAENTEYVGRYDEKAVREQAAQRAKEA
jgi:ABC-type sugar transport system ATPase subunit